MEKTSDTNLMNILESIDLIVNVVSEKTGNVQRGRGELNLTPYYPNGYDMKYKIIATFTMQEDEIEVKMNNNNFDDIVKIYERTEFHVSIKNMIEKIKKEHDEFLKKERPLDTLETMKTHTGLMIEDIFDLYKEMTNYEEDINRAINKGEKNNE